MQLKWLSVAELIAEAGGDPWAINQSLQAGSPLNDSAEVQRLVKSLGAQSEQLPKIGTDLEEHRRRAG
ncbi:hypothetical protein O980_07360 [Mycobacterium avium subsp. paratuberculosis 08-8281]|nr:hypothetical protein O980_07360 [Mycobacterium avium subsp. paratuberculosis 08-8281]